MDLRVEQQITLALIIIGLLVAAVCAGLIWLRPDAKELPYEDPAEGGGRDGTGMGDDVRD